MAWACKCTKTMFWPWWLRSWCQSLTRWPISCWDLFKTRHLYSRDRELPCGELIYCWDIPGGRSQSWRTRQCLETGLWHWCELRVDEWVRNAVGLTFVVDHATKVGEKRHDTNYFFKFDFPQIAWQQLGTVLMYYAMQKRESPIYGSLTSPITPCFEWRSQQLISIVNNLVTIATTARNKYAIIHPAISRITCLHGEM